MYVIKADGKLLYSPELIDEGYRVISPRMHLELGVAGSLDFTIPPCNALYDDVLKMKSIIMVEQDGEVVFRGRVSEETVDTYKQRRVYCEGDLSFLLDSLQAPSNFSGTQYDLFVQLIASHNAQMDAEKQFTLGDVSGLDREETFNFTTTTYYDTMNMVQTYLIDLFGGYIQTRTEGDVHYIDYVDGFTDECSQKIEFGVNLLNFESQINAMETCTVLVPLGATQDDGTALTIASVNDGKVYIENPEAVERFGRVYKTYTWENVTDPAELLELGNEYMQGAGIPETLSITAVDMHLLDADVEKIRKGSMVHLRSKPHGLDKKIVCASIDADLENGDQTVFGFGLPKQRLKTLAEQAAESAAGLDSVTMEIDDYIWPEIEDTWTEIYDFIWPEINDTWTEIEDVIWPEIEDNIWPEINDTRTEIDDFIWPEINDTKTELDNTNTEVQRVSGEVEDQHKWLTETETSLNVTIENLDLIGHRVNQVEVDVDAAEAAITLKANQTSVDVLEERMSGAEVRIDGAEAEITLKAAQSTVTALETRMSGAEVRIDGAEAEITLKAAQSTVDSLGSRMSSAEIRISGAESEIDLKADLILLDGYVKTGELETEMLYVMDGASVDSMSINTCVGGYADFDEVACGQLYASTLYIGGNALSKSSKRFITSVTVLEDSDGIYGISTDSEVIYYYT